MSQRVTVKHCRCLWSGERSTEAQTEECFLPHRILQQNHFCTQVGSDDDHEFDFVNMSTLCFISSAIITKITVNVIAEDCFEHRSEH